jgi:hypothetical protein
LIWPLWKTVKHFLKKFKIELLYNQEVPLLGIYPKVRKSLMCKDICTPTITAALFIIAKTQK